MIVSFGSKDTEKIWNGERVKKIPIEIQQIGRRKLRIINNSQNWSDLRIPPSNRLEKLQGSDFCSIRINDQRRVVVFRWTDNNAHDVEIIDYHQKLETYKMERLANIHPGEILLEEFLLPLEITAYRLSQDTEIPQTRISQIIKGKRRITADTALRFSSYFGTTAKFWLGTQDDYDIEEERKDKQDVLTKIKMNAPQ